MKPPEKILKWTFKDFYIFYYKIQELLLTDDDGVNSQKDLQW
jgi:hypothetical protein